MTDDRILDINEAAKFLKISPDTLYNLAKRRQVPHKRLGRQYRFHLDGLDAFVRDGVDPTDFHLGGGWLSLLRSKLTLNTNITTGPV